MLLLITLFTQYSFITLAFSDKSICPLTPHINDYLINKPSCYEQPEAKKEYYSKLWDKVQFTENDEDIHSIYSCIKQSMQKPIQAYRGGPSYIECNAARDPIKQAKRLEPPCLHEKVAGIMTYAIYEVKNCIDFDFKELMKIQNTESRFYPNVLSATHASGPGQLTEQSIEQVLNNHQMNNAIFTKCPHLKTYFHETNNQLQWNNIKYKCSRVPNLENQFHPIKNTLFSALYLSYLNSQVIKHFNKIFPFDLKPNSKLHQELTRFAYNAGQGRLRNLLKSLKENTPSKKINHQNFLNTFTTHIENIIKSKPKVAQINERLQAINDEIELLEKEITQLEFLIKKSDEIYRDINRKEREALIKEKSESQLKVLPLEQLSTLNALKIEKQSKTQQVTRLHQQINQMQMMKDNLEFSNEFDTQALEEPLNYSGKIEKQQMDIFDKSCQDFLNKKRTL